MDNNFYKDRDSNKGKTPDKDPAKNPGGKPSKNHGTKKYNRLINEQSPYLLAHAGNPVDWYPWSEEAFKMAISEDKPVFLSIGYSSCHWCHVMEEESFEDRDVAKLLNDTFISIKVDREERPDIDKIYMDMAQLMTGRGGWPLTIIMTPDKKPFYAATYIPKLSRYGMPGIIDIIHGISEIWSAQRQKAVRSAEQVQGHIVQYIEKKYTAGSALLEKTVLDDAFKRFNDFFDGESGGFGSAPKFPMPHNLMFLLRYWKRTGNAGAVSMVEKTLQAMRSGGIWDHIGNGFHRYSTDRNWLVPHFEKMLYDQALLSLAYTEAYQATKNDVYKDTAEKILEYVLSNLTSEEGGFYSAEDADSEGEEGKFYVWEYEEIRKLLNPDDFLLAEELFNIGEKGNYKDEASGNLTGKNILHVIDSIPDIASRYGFSEEYLAQRIDEIRKKIFYAREKRVRPFKDDKILTDWNGLMIASFARASQAFKNMDYANTAIRAADFILAGLYDSKTKELSHMYRGKKTKPNPNLDDYSFMVMGLLELYEATFNTEYLDASIDLNEKLISDYWDNRDGGFYFTPDLRNDVIIRMKSSSDGAIPSGNSVAVLNLLKLAKITGRQDYTEKAEKAIRVFSTEIRQSPDFHAFFLIALDFLFGPTYEAVITGISDSKDTHEMLGILRKEFIPNKILLLKPAEITDPKITETAKFIGLLTAIEGKATAYICRNFQCSLPVTDPAKMLELFE